MCKMFMACANEGALTTQRGSNSRPQRSGHRPMFSTPFSTTQCSTSSMKKFRSIIVRDLVQLRVRKRVPDLLQAVPSRVTCLSHILKKVLSLYSHLSPHSPVPSLFLSIYLGKAVAKFGRGPASQGIPSSPGSELSVQCPRPLRCQSAGIDI
jgi:hypothetical protein